MAPGLSRALQLVMAWLLQTSQALAGRGRPALRAAGVSMAGGVPAQQHAGR